MKVSGRQARPASMTNYYSRRSGRNDTPTYLDIDECPPVAPPPPPPGPAPQHAQFVAHRQQQMMIARAQPYMPQSVSEYC